MNTLYIGYITRFSFIENIFFSIQKIQKIWNVLWTRVFQKRTTCGRTFTNSVNNDLSKSDIFCSQRSAALCKVRTKSEHFASSLFVFSVVRWKPHVWLYSVFEPQLVLADNVVEGVGRLAVKLRVVQVVETVAWIDTGCSEKMCFFTIHFNPSLVYIAVKDLQSSQRNASVQSLLLAGNFLYNQ